MRAWWLCVLAVGACGRIGFDPIGDSGGASADGSYSGSGCVSPGIGDSFDETVPCEAWGGVELDNTMLSVSNGQLTITPEANEVAAGGCFLSSMPFTDAGLFVQIAQYPSVGELQLAIEDTGTGTSWGIASTDQLEIEFAMTGDSTSPTIPYDASIAWWRLRPSGNNVVYETSADGETWTIQRTAAGAAPATVGATINEIVDDPAPGSAIIDGIDICP